jgi:hypothetical protein
MLSAKSRDKNGTSNFFNNLELFSIYHFRNGIYQGELRNNKKYGFGAFYWDSGEFYFGTSFFQPILIQEVCGVWTK